MTSKISALIAFSLCLSWLPSPVSAADEKVPLLGSWINTDPKTQWVGQIDLVDEDGKIFMEIWAIQGGGLSREPISKIELPIDGKTLRIPPLVGVSVSHDYNFKDVEYTLKRKGAELQLTGKSTFKDGTNRDYSKTERFKKMEN